METVRRGEARRQVSDFTKRQRGREKKDEFSKLKAVVRLTIECAQGAGKTLPSLCLSVSL
jgi:hypothetical protein